MQCCNFTSTGSCIKCTANSEKKRIAERQHTAVTIFEARPYIPYLRIRERDRFRMAYLKRCGFGMAGRVRCKICKICHIRTRIFRDRGVRLYALHERLQRPGHGVCRVPTGIRWRCSLNTGSPWTRLRLGLVSCKPRSSVSSVLGRNDYNSIRMPRRAE